jgi:hypothetical protein
MKTFLTLFIGAVLLANPAKASGTTAAEMFDECNSGPNGEDYRLCQGFMAGFAQGVFGLMSLDESKQVCLPDYFAGNELFGDFYARDEEHSRRKQGLESASRSGAYGHLDHSIPLQEVVGS